MNTTNERRRYARQEIERPCKVFRRATQRYAPATTRDVSAGGALLHVQCPRPLAVGEQLDVGVAWSRSPILLEDALLEAKVVRVIPVGLDRYAVGIQFDRLAEAAAAA